jgi:hypothetical protein
MFGALAGHLRCPKGIGGLTSPEDDAKKMRLCRLILPRVKMDRQVHKICAFSDYIGNALGDRIPPYERCFTNAARCLILSAQFLS